MPFSSSYDGLLWGDHSRRSFSSPSSFPGWPFQFTPNLFHTMVLFYIVFIEAELCKPCMEEFAYIYASKLSLETMASNIRASEVQIWRASEEFVAIWTTTTIRTFSILQIALVNLDLPVSSDRHLILVFIIIFFYRSNLIIFFHCRSTPLPQA